MMNERSLRYSIVGFFKCAVCHVEAFVVSCYGGWCRRSKEEEALVKRRGRYLLELGYDLRHRLNLLAVCNHYMMRH